MWAALFSGVPTINLHTSAFPNSWPLRDFYFHQGRSFTNKDLLREVRRWARRHKLNPARIRVIEKKTKENRQTRNHINFFTDQIKDIK